MLVDVRTGRSCKMTQKKKINKEFKCRGTTNVEHEMY